MRLAPSVMRPVTRLVVGVGLVSSVALLSYSVVLAMRVRSGGPGHIGGDLIAGCYVLAVLAIGTASSLYGASSSAGLAAVRHWLLAFAVVAATLWLGLHLGGFVFSHGSMFTAQLRPSIERMLPCSVLRTPQGTAHSKC
jgi:hypothetical protein